MAALPAVGACSSSRIHTGAGPSADWTGYYLINLIGNPLNTVTMVANLMFSGTLEAVPDLKWVLAHGGGYVPYQLGRLQHGWGWRPECREHCKTGPDPLNL